MVFDDPERARRAAQWLHGMRVGHEQLHVTVQAAPATRNAAAAACAPTPAAVSGASGGGLPPSLALHAGREGAGHADDAPPPGARTLGGASPLAPRMDAAAAQISATYVQVLEAATEGALCPAAPLDSPRQHTHIFFG